MKKCFLVIYLIFSSWCFTHAQLDNRVFYDSIQSSDERGVFIGLRGTGYFRNTEYFNPVVSGATLFGFHTMPTVSVVPVEGITLQAGALIRSDFGRFGKQTIDPVFSVHYSVNRFSFTFGSLEGHLRHGLSEPLYDFERWIDHRIEQGVQLQYHLPDFFQTDTWIEWQQVTYPGTQNKEAFWAGTTGFYRMISSKHSYMDLRWQGTVYHVGGQLDTLNTPAFSQFNGAVGVRVGVKSREDAHFYGEAYYFGHSNSDKQAFMQATQGNAWMATTHVTKGRWQAQVNYWNATHWYTEQGGPIYRSFSVETGQPVFFESNRQMVWLRVFLDIPLQKSFDLSLRGEVVHDLSGNRTEYGYGLYLNYRLGTRVYPL